MNESKIEITNRLQREDRWSEASVFKDEHIAKLRADGMTRKEAQQAAWEAMEGKFPPVEDIDQTSAVELAVDVSQFASNDSPEFFEDAQWVYQHLLVSSVNPEDAPSSGAWGLLKWAKRNQNRFFEHVMQKVATTKEKAPPANPDELPEEYMQDLTEIRRMIAPWHSRWEEEVVEDSAEALNGQLAELISDWQRQFHLELSLEASKSWTRQMVRLSDEMLRAVLKDPETYMANHEEMSRS